MKKVISFIFLCFLFLNNVEAYDFDSCYNDCKRGCNNIDTSTLEGLSQMGACTGYCGQTCQNVINSINNGLKDTEEEVVYNEYDDYYNFVNSCVKECSQDGVKVNFTLSNCIRSCDTDEDCKSDCIDDYIDQLSTITNLNSCVYSCREQATNYYCTDNSYMEVIDYCIWNEIYNQRFLVASGDYSRLNNAINNNCLNLSSVEVHCELKEMLNWGTKFQCGDFKIPYMAADIVSTFITLIKVAVPLVIIFLGSLDLVKAVMAQKDDEIKKGQQTFIRRLLIGASVFLVFALVQMVIGLVAPNDGDNNMWQCVDCFVNGDCTRAN